jgi:hypothetical protein
MIDLITAKDAKIVNKQVTIGTPDDLFLNATKEINRYDAADPRNKTARHVIGLPLLEGLRDEWAIHGGFPATLDCQLCQVASHPIREQPIDVFSPVATDEHVTKQLAQPEVGARKKT